MPIISQHLLDQKFRVKHDLKTLLHIGSELLVPRLHPNSRLCAGGSRSDPLTLNNRGVMSASDVIAITGVDGK